MSKILITGNGFDLFHGLPTKYGHFMSVMTTIEESNFQEDLSFNDLFQSFFKGNFQKDYDFLVENYDVDKIRFLNSEISEINTLLRENHWFRHFKSVLNLQTWIDFEMEIENVLWQLSVLFNESKENKNNVNSYRLTNLNISENFTNFKITGVSDQGHLFVKEAYLDLRTKKIDERKVLEHLVTSLEQFSSIFNKYLISIVSRFSDLTKLKSSDINFNVIDEFYTFNYTNSLEGIYNINKEKIVYLHGKINIVQRLVLGISDMPELLKKNKIFGFTKYYQKIKKNSNNRFIDLNLKESNNLSETIFYIIGHSLDESDKGYVEDLFKYLKLDRNGFSKICVFYHNDSDYSSKLNNLIRIIGENDVVEMNKVDRLYFVELNNENITKQFSLNLKSAKVPYV